MSLDFFLGGRGGGMEIGRGRGAVGMNGSEGGRYIKQSRVLRARVLIGSSGRRGGREHILQAESRALELYQNLSRLAGYVKAHRYIDLTPPKPAWLILCLVANASNRNQVPTRRKREEEDGGLSHLHDPSPFLFSFVRAALLTTTQVFQLQSKMQQAQG